MMANYWFTTIKRMMIVYPMKYTQLLAVGQTTKRDNAVGSRQ